MSHRAAHPERLIWWLSMMVAAGITAVLPVLPLYARNLGADNTFIGLMMGGFWAANLVGLPVGGWLSDRWGRKPMMLLGLLAYGLGSLGFLLVESTPWFVVFRAIEGLGAACFNPAALAYVADRAPAGEQGRRVADLAAAENTGILLGPVAGGLVASQWGLGSPFLVLGLLCALGAVLALGLPESHRRSPRPLEVAPVTDWREADWPVAIGLAFRFVAVGFSMGLAEVIWPLFVTDWGGQVWHVSLSWTLFAVPSLLLARPVGRLIDRSGAGRPAVLGAAMFAGISLFYPLAGGPWQIVALSVVEGIGFALAYPGQNALLVQAAPEALRGRMIGLVSTVRTLFAVVGALVTPWLYDQSPALCFGAMAAVHLLGMLGLGGALLWRRRLSANPQQKETVT